MVCTTWRKLSFAALALTLLAACGEPEREGVEASRDSVVAPDEDGRLSASALCTFDIYAKSMYIQRDQRTRTGNYEGELELAGDFYVNNASWARFPSSGYIKVGQGGNVAMNTFIGSVSIGGAGAVDLSAYLVEEEYGFGGGPDYGSNSGSISLDCNQSGSELTFLVLIGGNTSLETTAQIYITFQATRRTGWTAWLNRDIPDGNGDYETLADFNPDEVCPNPIAIECQTLNGVDWTQTGEVYTCNPSVGGYCVNSNQPDGTCLDYRVRFLCP